MNWGKLAINAGIEQYWTKVIQLRDNNGDSKYPMLAVVISALFTISEANREVERLFKDLQDFCTDVEFFLISSE